MAYPDFNHNITEVTNDDESKRFQKLLRLIFTLCELCGFHLEGRITVRDKKTGRIWK